MAAAHFRQDTANSIHRTKTLHADGQPFHRNHKVRSDGRGSFRSVEEFIHTYLKRVAPDTDPAVLQQPVGELAPLLTRFDWRSLQIVPEVAEQAGNTCWAETASAAFEASLRRQRANFSTMKQGEAKFTVEVFLLNVDSTLDHVPPGRDQEASGGRHETAFNFYFNKGIPLKEILISE